MCIYCSAADRHSARCSTPPPTPPLAPLSLLLTFCSVTSHLSIQTPFNSISIVFPISQLCTDHPHLKPTKSNLPTVTPTTRNKIGVRSRERVGIWKMQTSIEATLNSDFQVEFAEVVVGMLIADRGKVD